jgi:hypothetical protein
VVVWLALVSSALAARPGLLVVHPEWTEGARLSALAGRSCGPMSLFEAEIAAVRRAASGAGYALTVVDAASLGPASLEGVELVVHHNGGWGSWLLEQEREALLAAHRAGLPVVFMGDDAAMMVAGDPEMMALLGVSRFLNNGRAPTQLQLLGRSVRYVKEPDEVMLLPEAQVTAWAEYTPAVWTVRRPDQAPVTVFDLSLRSSELCGMVSPEDEPLLESFFRGALAPLAQR